MQKPDPSFVLLDKEHFCERRIDSERERGRTIVLVAGRGIDSSCAASEPVDVDAIRGLLARAGELLVVVGADRQLYLVCAPPRRALRADRRGGGRRLQRE